MAALASLASHKPGRNGLRREQGEGTRRRLESEAVTGCVGQTSWRLALVEAHHTAPCARSGVALAFLKMLKRHSKTPIYSRYKPAI